MKWLSTSGILRAIILLYSVLQIYNSEEHLQHNVTNIFFVAAMSFVIIISIWLNVESEKDAKENEIRLHKLYYRSFESIITDLRRRQHEFDNQLAAIQGLHHSNGYDTPITDIQKQYINEIRDERLPICLLSSTINPLVAGFLYTKYLEAKEQGVYIEFNITSPFPENVPISVQVEMLGILIDNAMEASAYAKKKSMKVSIAQEDNQIVFVVQNQYHKLENREIERFFNDGVSTKGQGRGIGLSRLREIVNQRKYQLMVSNENINGENWLSFKVFFRC